MVELKSCASLVNVSAALCAIEEEVKEENGGVNVVGEIILSELEREREKNAALMEKISVLEARIQSLHKDLASSTHGQGRCSNATVKGDASFKRRKIGASLHGVEDDSLMMNVSMPSQIKYGSPIVPCSSSENHQDNLVNRMNSNESQSLITDKIKDNDSPAESNDIDDSNGEDDCEEGCTGTDHLNKETNVSNREPERYLRKDCIDKKAFSCLDEGRNVDEETKPIESCNKSANDSSFKDVCDKVPSSRPWPRKLPKVPFCPKEVRKILESDVLLLKNAQSHTIRKTLVFASLGIRHGCDDMHELDFNHFRILSKGEPYVSPQDPGEHVLYENPGVKRKILYPNRQNPTLCPVQILEEEKAMRPSDSGCPSCLFLCIKYGGRTRNLPQNEYVRQQMGRNKLKFFGPEICRIAMLVHVRSGSFFFKAIGITLLYMAGFPDGQVQRETKYQNLGLLQKYYRTDEDAEGEELFLQCSVTNNKDNPGSDRLTGRSTTSTKTKGKRPENLSSKANINCPASLTTPPSSAVTPAIGFMGYHGTAAFQCMQAHAPPNNLPVANQMINNADQNQTTYPVFPPHPANGLMPMMYWYMPTSLPPTPYPSAYGYHSFPALTNYVSIQGQPYYRNPFCSSLVTNVVAERNVGKNDVALEEADADSQSSSSSSNIEPEEVLASSKLKG